MHDSRATDHAAQRPDDEDDVKDASSGSSCRPASLFSSLIFDDVVRLCLGYGDVPRDCHVTSLAEPNARTLLSRDPPNPPRPDADGNIHLPTFACRCEYLAVMNAVRIGFPAIPAHFGAR